jgi:VWFA-related protein
MRSGLATILFLLFAIPLASQTPLKEVVIHSHPYVPPSAILHAGANLVETGLMVRDARGHAVGGLQASDFEVLDNGVPRRIAAFSEVRSGSDFATAPSGGISGTQPLPMSQPPKYITFFFDDLHAVSGNTQFVKQGARAFIARGVRTGDHLSIVTASGEGDLDFTTDPERFAERLEHISSRVHPVVPGYCGVSAIDSYIFLHNLDGDIREAAIAAAEKCAGCGPGEAPASCRSKATAIATSEASSTWEQIHAVSLDTMSALGYAAKKLARASGTRTLVLTSSGFLLRPGEPPELQNFIDAALRWNITVHTIGAQGLEARMTGAKDMVRTAPYLAPLEEIANGTGGHFFKDSNDLAGAMKLATDPEVSYTLAFSAGEADGKFHTLKIRFQPKRGGGLEYRPGYFSPDPKKETSARARMDDAVFLKKTLREIPASMTLRAGEMKDGAGPIAVQVSVDLSNVPFTYLNGRHFQQLVFLTTLLDSTRGFVAGKESIMELALGEEKLASMKKDGLKAIVTLSAPAGVYVVRAVVREGVKGNLATIGAPVEVRAR